ncbi:14-3-3 D [Olea europaea subsp. europaea]|uniref:14-3-3 D n=1 Tax=Olea europaea subsp. europaea TaxID=158383 RepID=A0A8S0SF66_OLEEU|nr:14-3-3 D [Olea europaea subsp. europaea]
MVPVRGQASGQAEGYEEMVQFMDKLVVGAAGSEITPPGEEGRKNDDHVVLVKDYRSKIETKLSDVCAGILKILNDHLIPSAASRESKVFYLKMKGDYCRYFAEFKAGNERKEAAEDTMLAYKAAKGCAAGIIDTEKSRISIIVSLVTVFSDGFYLGIVPVRGQASGQAEGYEEMVQFMDKLVVGAAGSEITVEERNLLSVAYKNVIGSLQAARRGGAQER